MAYEEKPGDGIMFENDKRGNDKWPDRTGYFLAHRDIRAGEKINLAGWLKTGKSGKRFMSLKVSDMRTKPASDDNSAPSPDDDIPW